MIFSTGSFCSQDVVRTIWTEGYLLSFDLYLALVVGAVALSFAAPRPTTQH
jgi:hypothetical protein